MTPLLQITDQVFVTGIPQCISLTWLDICYANPNCRISVGINESDIVFTELYYFLVMHPSSARLGSARIQLEVEAFHLLTWLVQIFVQLVLKKFMDVSYF